jgi:uncharacterized membrane protein
MMNGEATPGLRARQSTGLMTADPPAAASARVDSSRARRGYLDWVRGLAVLIMIEAHVVDSWTAAPDRFGKTFAWAMVVGGFGAPLFLFLAGVAVSLSAGSKARRFGDAGLASRAVVRRGLEIFLLAFLFRVQAWILGWSSPRLLLRVDILNVMGPAIVVAAALWRTRATASGRVAVFLAATLATTLLTPIIRAAAILGQVPDPLESYLRPAGSVSGFSLFPWAGFVFAGALIGVLLDGVRPGSDDQPKWPAEARVNLGFLAGGAVLAGAAYAASFLATPYAKSDFWTSSPAFFLLRLGVLIAVTGAGYFWEIISAGSWSPLQQLGRTSLFIYWIHVEMVYGLASLPLHHGLTLQQTWVALFLFSLFMLACSIAKDWLVERRGARRESRTRRAPPILPSSL